MSFFLLLLGFSLFYGYTSQMLTDIADHREDPLKIMKLNGTNYHEWKDDIKSLLILKD